MSEKMREEFEAWAATKGWESRNMKRRTDGGYDDWSVQPMWLSWQASRAALVIELPPMPTAQRTDEEATFSGGGCDMRRRCSKAIEAAGLKVKP
jgi:hypothetical protein